MPIHLSQAYVWDCPHCGMENFQRAVSTNMTPEEEREAALKMGLIEEWEDVDDDVSGVLLTYPDEVHCSRCKKSFSTISPPAFVDGPLEDDDDDDDEDYI